MVNSPKLQTLFIVLCFFAVSLHAQKDSLEVERLVKIGSNKNITGQKKIIVTFEKALIIINDSILTKDLNNHYFLLKKALILDELSYYYRKQTDYTLSLKSALESLKIKERIGETFTLSRSFRNLGRIYHYNKDTIKTIQFYNNAMKLAKKYKNNEEVVNTLNAFAIYYTSKNLEQTKKYANKAYKYADSIKFNKGKALALANLSGYERRKKNYKAAIVYSEKDLEINLIINNKVGMERSYKDLGYSYRKLKQPEKALLYYEKSLKLVVEMELENLLANRFLSVSNAYTDLEQHKTAFSFYRLYKRQQIKDLNVKSIKEFAQLDAKYTYERQKTIDSIQFVEQEKIKKTLLLREASTRFWKITSIIIGVFGLFFIGVTIILRKRKEQIKLSKLKNEILQNEIKFKQKDLSDFALNISRNRKWREELLTYIKKVKKSDLVKKDTNFMALEKAIINRDHIDNKAINIKNKVDILTNAFYQKLQEKHPTLTKSEIKLCSYIRLNIEYKEIATLQNIAIDSVYRSRTRLRKKLNLSSEDDLDIFLSDF